MEFNLVVPGIELVGTTVKTLTIGNNIVDVEKEAKRSCLLYTSDAADE